MARIQVLIHPLTRDAFQPVYGGGDIDGLLLKIRFAQ